jgi:hypothetical protein
MGNEANCTARFGKQESAGKALLETSELLFRGDFRLTITFQSITSVKAVAGELRIEFSDGKAVFVIGPLAQKWAHKIQNPKSLLEKLGVKPGETLAILGVDDTEFSGQLRDLGCRVNAKSGKDTGWIFLGAEAKAVLARIKSLAAAMKKDASIWVVYPKGQKHISESDVVAAGRKAGLKDVKVVGFSATHTALKFVVPLSKR